MASTAAIVRVLRQRVHQRLPGEVDRELLSTVKILLNFLQTTSFLADFNLDWPSVVLRVFSFSGSVTVFSLNSSVFTCTVPLDQRERFLFALLLLPIILIVPAIGIRARVRWYKREEAKRLDADPDAVPVPLTIFGVSPLGLYTTVVLMLLFFLYPMVTFQALVMFRCTDPIDGVRYLTTDVSVRCDDDTHRAFQALALVVLGAFTVGFPALTAFLLYRFRTRLDSEKAKRRYWFLYSGYKKERFYYESVIMLRKACLVGVSVMLGGNRFGHQIFLGILVLLTTLILHLTLEPFADQTQGWLEQIAVISALLSLLFGQLFALGGISDVVRLLITVVVATLGIGVVALCVGLIVLDLYRAAVSRRIAQRLRLALAQQSRALRQRKTVVFKRIRGVRGPVQRGKNGIGDDERGGVGGDGDEQGVPGRSKGGDDQATGAPSDAATRLARPSIVTLQLQASRRGRRSIPSGGFLGADLGPPRIPGASLDASAAPSLSVGGARTGASQSPLGALGSPTPSRSAGPGDDGGGGSGHGDDHLDGDEEDSDENGEGPEADEEEDDDCFARCERRCLGCCVRANHATIRFMPVVQLDLDQQRHLGALDTFFRSDGAAGLDWTENRFRSASIARPSEPMEDEEGGTPSSLGLDDAELGGADPARLRARARARSRSRTAGDSVVRSVQVRGESFHRGPPKRSQLRNVARSVALAGPLAKAVLEPDATDEGSVASADASVRELESRAPRFTNVVAASLLAASAARPGSHRLSVFQAAAGVGSPRSGVASAGSSSVHEPSRSQRRFSPSSLAGAEESSRARSGSGASAGASEDLVGESRRRTASGSFPAVLGLPTLNPVAAVEDEPRGMPESPGAGPSTASTASGARSGARMWGRVRTAGLLSGAFARKRREGGAAEDADAAGTGALDPPASEAVVAPARKSIFSWGSGATEAGSAAPTAAAAAAAGGSTSRDPALATVDEARETVSSLQRLSDLAAEWKTCTHPVTKEPYWYNPRTRQTTWERPKELEALETQTQRVWAAWERRAHPSNGFPYWVNPILRQQQWERPANLPVREEEAWWQLVHPENRVPYYVNVLSKRVQWEVPAEFIPAPLTLLPPSVQSLIVALPGFSASAVPGAMGSPVLESAAPGGRRPAALSLSRSDPRSTPLDLEAEPGRGGASSDAEAARPGSELALKRQRVLHKALGVARLARAFGAGSGGREGAFVGTGSGGVAIELTGSSSAARGSITVNPLASIARGSGADR